MPPPLELGLSLRERREAMGATLAEVEAATRIRQKYLAALEADEWQSLPGEIVGRGFLRNYASYLGLDPNELVERRRSLSDATLSSALFNTSAGSAMPADRTVDYRPKDVPLRDEPEAIQQREIRLAPFFTAMALFGALFLLWWVVSSFGGQIGTAVGAVVSGFQTRTASMPVEPTFTLVPTTLAAVAPDSPAQQETATPTLAENIDPNNNNPSNNSDNSLTNNTPQTLPAVTTPPGLILVPTPTPPNSAPAANDSPPVTTDGGVNITPTIAITVATPIVTPTLAAAAASPPTETPTATPEPPTPVPTDTPTPVPTNTPVLVIAPQCPDPRVVLTTPGVNQVVSGNIAVTGRATHENFDYYKLEFAPGANAGDGFVYFAGDKNQIEGGLLGGLDTSALPNGVYTLRLVVVDLTGNFPPPCQVTVTIQN